jgi:hypothetical protein
MKKRQYADSTIPPISGSFKDTVRAMLKTPPAPKNLGRPKGKPRRPAPDGEALVQSVTKPITKKRKATKKKAAPR